MPPYDSCYFTRKQAAEYIVSHEITIDRLIRDGKLPAAKLSKRFVRIKRSDLDKLIEANTIGRIGVACHD
jgi:excisionase family DNA binding protein